MTDTNPALIPFIDNVKKQQALWGLQDESGDGWVVCDSSEYENTDVMPLWSTKEQAQVHCCDEWAGYQAIAITLNDFLDFWVEDLNQDGVLVGIDWEAGQTCLEIDPILLAQSLVNIEKD